MHGITVLSVSILAYPLLVFGNLYDPHVFPEQGPFFEGWYMRFLDFTTKRSFGVLLGTVLPLDPASGRNRAFVGILRGQPNQALVSDAVLPHVGAFNITVLNGQPVTKNPNMTSPADFDITISSVGHISVKPNKTTISLLIEDVHLEATIGAAAPWGPDGQGPESWAYHLGNLLPIHWFVYSLRSPLLEYKVSDLKSGIIHSGNNGYVHMEKNWGGAFPSSWVWSQSISETNPHITYAFSYALVNAYDVASLPGHLFGFRNPTKDLVVDMSPLNSISSTHIDGCNGTIEATFTGWMYKVNVKVSAHMASFSRCLYCPEKNGFRRGSVQSFTANAELIVYQRKYGLFFEEVDRQKFEGFAALEFGGTHVCGGTCT